MHLYFIETDPGFPVHQVRKYKNWNSIDTNANDKSSKFTCNKLLWLRGRMVGESIITASKRSLGQGNVFTPMCHYVQVGWLPGMHHRSHDRGGSSTTGGRGFCLQGDLHPVGVFLQGGLHASRGRCLPPGGLHPGEVCIQEGEEGWADPLPIGYYGIWSSSGQYASYWNAFLLLITTNLSLST